MDAARPVDVDDRSSWRPPRRSCPRRPTLPAPRRVRRGYSRAQQHPYGAHQSGSSDVGSQAIDTRPTRRRNGTVDYPIFLTHDSHGFWCSAPPAPKPVRSGLASSGRTQDGVHRTAFYGNRPYSHLRTEFEDRRQQAAELGPDTRPENGADPTTQHRGREAQDTARRKRIPQSANSPTSEPARSRTRRPTRRDQAAPHAHRSERRRHPPATSTTESHRTTLTPHRVVTSANAPFRFVPTATRLPIARNAGNSGLSRLA